MQAVERARHGGAGLDRHLSEPRPLDRQDLPPRAQERVETLKAMGFKHAQLYGADAKGFLGGLNAFFLLLSKPGTYNLPENPKLPQRNVVVDSLLSIGSALIVGLGALLAFRDRGKGRDDASDARRGDDDRPALRPRRA